MPDYILFLHRAPNFLQPLSQKEREAAIQQFGAWSGRLRDKGVLVGLEKLQDDGGRTLRKANGKVAVEDGPVNQAREQVGAYLLVQAPDYAGVVEAMRDCPNLEYGPVEIREIQKMR